MNSTESAKRPSGKRPKKRKFTGNMHTRCKAVHSVDESLNNSASGKKIPLSSKMLGKRKNIPEINRRFVYAMKTIGQGHAAMTTLCGVMDFPPPVAEKSYNNIINKLQLCSKEGTSLRKLKQMSSKLSDGKSIGGKGRLTDRMIDLITTYYGNAIRQNKTCLSDMRKAVWAVYFHIRSRDEEPLHSFWVES
ncbi:uncharacterized protein TNCV_3583531 [Trichonephila clavipes]|nr:uncharacterized protein TNCV_3583531 [Trichonephila clavipes]